MPAEVGHSSIATAFDSGGVGVRGREPVLMRMYARVALPEGEAELLLRSPGLTRVWLNGEVVMSTTARKLNPDAHQPLIVYEPDMPWLRVPRVGDKEVREKRTLSGGMTESLSSRWWDRVVRGANWVKRCWRFEAGIRCSVGWSWCRKRATGRCRV